jgi:hypothetical protein
MLERTIGEQLPAVEISVKIYIPIEKLQLALSDKNGNLYLHLARFFRFFDSFRRDPNIL